MVRPHELQCCHGIGHQMGIHGCDGCCGLIFGGLVEQTEERIIKLLERLWEKTQGTDLPAVVVLPEAIELIKGETNETR